MSRLIIVDQSLKGLGGHHFDYTLQVASAAAGRQCEVIVGANRKYKGCSRLDHFARIHPVFRNTSYSRYSLLAGLRAMFGQPPLELGGNKKPVLSFVDQEPDSQHGPMRRILQRQWDRITTSRSRMNTRLRYLRESTGRNRVVKSFARDCQTLFRSVGLHEHDHVFFPTVSDLDLAGLMTYWLSNPESHLPVWHMQFHFDVFLGRSPDYRKQMLNLNPLRDLFDDIERAVPSYHLNYYATTTSIADQYQRLSTRRINELAYPISEGFLHSNQDGQSTHLQVLSATSKDSRSRSESELVTKITKRSNEDNVSEVLPFSDDHLTIEQLKRLTVHTESSRNFGEAEEPSLDFPANYRGVPIVVAGGVRDEKGQACLTHLLPELDKRIFNRELGFLVCQRKLQKRWWKKPTFSLSCNQNRNSEQEENQKNSAFDRSIYYLPHPLEPKNYQQLIRGAGIGLLAYDRESYANRRAGIFGEYLAAGVPVLVPAGTWMSDQLESVQQLYLQRIRKESTFIQRIQFQQLDWADWNVPTANGAVSFDGMEVPAYAWTPAVVALPEAKVQERLVSVRFQWLWPKEAGTYCKVQILFHSKSNDVLGSASRVIGGSGERKTCESLFSIPEETETIRIGFSNAYHERNASLQKLQVEILGSPHPVPIGAVGLTYDSMEQIPELLTEMCLHHDHYRQQAQKFAQQWYEGHDPTLTVTQLMSASQAAYTWAA